MDKFMNAPICPTAADARRSISQGSLTSETLVQHCLQRVEAREPTVQAWAHLDAEAVIEAAKRADAEPRRGPLCGIPVGVKDLFDTHDMPTAYGSEIYTGHVPASDAAAVALIRRAGGVVMGKTVTTEFAFFQPGKTRNPHDPDRTPGGSSSGSAAAVADGMVPLAIGTQTAGSVIRPASFCGVVGYKPTFGLISPAGLKVAAWSLDTVGVFARNVHDAALLAGALSDRGLGVVMSSPARPPRFGLCRTPQWDAASEDTDTALAEAAQRIASAGGQFEERPLPDEFSDLLSAQKTIMAYEAARSLAFEHDVHAHQLSSMLKKLLVEGMNIPARAYDDARRLAARCRTWLADVFADIDVLLAPSAPGVAPERATGTGDPIFNRIWTLLGTPCVNVPGLHGRDGLPVGVQVIGPRHQDQRTLGMSHWLADRLQHS